MLVFGRLAKDLIGLSDSTEKYEHGLGVRITSRGVDHEIKGGTKPVV